MFGLTKKVFGFSDKKIEQKFNDYLKARQLAKAKNNETNVDEM